MRILHVTPYFWPAAVYGGVPRSLHELSREQARQGDAVRVVATDVLDERRRDAGGLLRSFDGIEAAYLPNVSNLLAQRAQGYLPRSGWSLAASWISWADVVHFHCHRILFFHLLEPALGSRPYVLSPRGSAGLHEGRRGRKRLYDAVRGDAFLRRAARVVALSAVEREDLLARGVDPARIVQIPHGIDWEADGPAGSGAARTGAADVLFLGKVTPLKGVDLLLEAVAGLPGVTLTVAGNDIGHTEAFRRRAAGADLFGRVRFPGFLEGHARERAIAGARAVAAPSRYDAFGLVPLEALRAGVPVVASRRCGSAAALAAEGLAFLADEDPASLRDAIRQALESPLRGPSLAAEARRRLSGRFGWGPIAASYRAVYGEALACGSC